MAGPGAIILGGRGESIGNPAPGDVPKMDDILPAFSYLEPIWAGAHDHV
jgi:hypothetical protein